MVKREHLPGSAESGRDFVGDQEDAVPVAERAQLRQELRRIDAHAGAALQQRFDDDRGGLVRMFREGGFRSGEAFRFAAFARFPIAAAVAVRRFDLDRIHQHRLINLRVQVHRADGQRADRFAMISLLEAHEPGSFGTSGLVHVLEAHFQRAFDRGGPVVGKIELRQSGRNDLQELFAEADDRFMGEVGEDDVFELVQLALDRCVNSGVAVSQQVAPPGADDIDIGTAFAVVEADASTKIGRASCRERV